MNIQQHEQRILSVLESSYYTLFLFVCLFKFFVLVLSNISSVLVTFLLFWRDIITKAMYRGIYWGFAISEHEFMIIMIGSIVAVRLTQSWIQSWKVPPDPQEGVGWGASSEWWIHLKTQILFPKWHFPSKTVTPWKWTSSLCQHLSFPNSFTNRVWEDQIFKYMNL